MFTGVEFFGSQFTGGITNSGVITAKTNAAVYVSASGFSGGITNTGSISGIVGIYLTPGNVSVTDSGTITGTAGTAIRFAGFGNSLTLNPGFVINGKVLGTGGDTLNLAGTGTGVFNLGQIGAGLQYQGLSSFYKAGSSTWMLTGTGNQHWNILSGTLELGNGGTSGTLNSGVSDNGTFAINRSDSYSYGYAITGTGGFLQAGTGTTVFTTAETYTGGTRLQAGALELGSGGSVFGNVTFADAGAGAILRLDTSTSQVGGTVGGFTGSDHIDLKFLAYANSLKAVWVENGSNTGGVLSIKKGNTTVATLNLSGVYTSQNFNLAADATGGTLITDPPAPGNSGNSNGNSGNSNALLVQAMAGFSSGGSAIQASSGVTSQDPSSQLGLLTASSLQHAA